MPPIEVCDLNQDAVLWEFVRQDRFGKPVVKTPVAIKVRWVANETQPNGPFKNTIGSTKTVITTRTIPIMSVLWQGRLKDLPDNPSDLREVTTVNTTPSLKATETRFEYTLTKYTQELPVISS